MIELRVLSGPEIKELLDADELVEALARALADLSDGKASVPPRIAAMVPEVEGLLAAMPSSVPSLGALETKLVSLFPHNRDRPTHQAVIVCFDPATGSPTALLDGTVITEVRTSAGSALATRLLAREDARVLAVLGTGVQAAAHARAVVRVRPIEEVWIAGRNREHTQELTAMLDAELPVSVRAAASFDDAVGRADVICAATHSPDPVVHRDRLRPGTHVNSVGYNTAGREVDEGTVADALVVVESRAAALAPPPAGANDLLWPLRDDVISQDHIHAEIGELVLGRASGRTSREQITLYKSVGVGVQDAAAAMLVLRAAEKRGAGSLVRL